MRGLMSEATCKNCGLLPIGEFYLSRNKPMGTCKTCHKTRVTKAQYKRREDYPARGLKVTRVEPKNGHGVSGYWSGCRCLICVEAKRAYMRAHYARHVNGNLSAKEQREAVQLKLFVKNQIRLLTKHGASRELIKRETKAPMDIVVDVLAELWDKGEVFTRKHGEERYFYLKRAA